MLFLSHPWAGAELENVVELDALRLDFPGIIAQATGFIYLSLQDLRAALAAPSEGAAVLCIHNVLGCAGCTPCPGALC